MSIELVEITGQEVAGVSAITDIEMSIFESAFLLKLLREKQPGNILEIGVSAGGTSVLLLKNTKPGQNIFGLDIAEQYYRRQEEKTGFLMDQHCNEEERMRYELYTGRDPLYVMRENLAHLRFDFVVLDTCHVLPGELLTFFAIYKYLNPGCIVVLHDILLNFCHFNKKSLAYRRIAYATNVLFTAVGSHRKMLPAIDRPNIGAFEIDSATEENIESAFMALSHTWAYVPSTPPDGPGILQDYYRYFRSVYPPFCANYFHACMEIQPKLVSGKW